MSKENKKEFLENKPQQVELKKDNGSAVAFKDFKNSITTEEFLSILAIVRHEYDMMSKVVKAKDKFKEKTNQGIEQVKNNSSGMPPGLAEKLIEGLERKATKRLHEDFSNEIKRHKAVV